MDKGILLGILPAYQGKTFKLTDEQSTNDIIEAILTAHKKYIPEYRKIAGYFQEGSRRATAKKLFDFCKANIKYRIESNEKQTVKSPQAILAQCYGDCKHYSSFIGGILGALHIPFAYRFASYRIFDKQPQHVFVVVSPGTANEIWVDPVLNSFDNRKPYNYARDKKIGMAIYSISGVGASKQQKQDLKAAKQAKKQAKGKPAKKAAKAVVKTARQAAGRTAGQVLKKGVKAVIKVAATPVRNAFLLLVDINFANLAVKLSKAWEKQPSKIQQFWEGTAGGKINNLKKAWEKGANKKRIFGNNYIGVAPAVAATAAAPLLVKVAEVLREIGIDPEELVQIGKDAVNDKAQELVKKVLEPKAAAIAEDYQIAEEVTETDPGEDPGTDQPGDQLGTRNQARIQKKDNLMPVLGIAALAAGAIYLMNK